MEKQEKKNGKGIAGLIISLILSNSTFCTNDEVLSSLSII